MYIQETEHLLLLRVIWYVLEYLNSMGIECLLYNSSSNYLKFFIILEFLNYLFYKQKREKSYIVINISYYDFSY